MNKPPRTRVAWNTATATVAQVVTILLGLITTPVILHSLGTTIFGAFALILSLMSYVGLLDLGIGGSLVRYMSLHHERKEHGRVAEIVTFGVLFYAMLGSAVAAALVFLAPAIARFLRLPADVASDFPRLLLLVLCIFIGTAMNGVLSARLSAAHRLDLASLASLIGAVFYATLIFTLVPGAPTLSVVLACIGAQVVLTAATLYLLNRRLGSPIAVSPHRLRWSNLKEIFSFGLWTQLSNLTAVINLEADKAIISRQIGVAQVTPYHIANRLALLNRFLPLQFLAALLPEITARVSRGFETGELEQLYARSARTLMVSTLAITGLIAGTADAILNLWLGTHVEAASALTIALVISYAVNNATGIGSIFFKATGQPQYEAYYGTISATLNIILTILLIQSYGLVGVIVGTVVGNVVGSTFFLFLFHRKTGLAWSSTTGNWLYRLAVMTTVSGLAAYGAVFVLGPHDGDRLVSFLALCVALAAYVLSYAATGHLLSFWTSEDYTRVRAILDFARDRRTRTHG